MRVAGQWRYVCGYVRGFVSGLLTTPEPLPAPQEPEDPEVLLAQAQQEMKEAQAKNRERAVQAITQKNNLQAHVGTARKKAADFQARAEAARLAGDAPREQQILTQLAALEASLPPMEASLADAIERVERVKVAMLDEEERVRAKTAQAMALKTQWKHAQILNAIDLATVEDSETALRPIRSEVQALVTQARRLSDELVELAERALRRGNRALARALLTQREELRAALSVA